MQELEFVGLEQEKPKKKGYILTLILVVLMISLSVVAFSRTQTSYTGSKTKPQTNSNNYDPNYEAAQKIIRDSIAENNRKIIDAMTK